MGLGLSSRRITWRHRIVRKPDQGSPHSIGAHRARFLSRVCQANDGSSRIQEFSALMVIAFQGRPPWETAGRLRERRCRRPPRTGRETFASSRPSRCQARRGQSQSTRYERVAFTRLQPP